MILCSSFLGPWLAMFCRLWRSLWNWFAGAPAEGENLSRPIMVIQGGTGGTGGGAMHRGGEGGTGEGPRIYNPAIETAVHGTYVCYQNPRNYTFTVIGPIPPRMIETWAMVIAYRFSEFTAGEKALFVVYCTAVTSWSHIPYDWVRRLVLGPIVAASFLVVPRLLFPHPIITLVDVIGERRPMRLDLWRNAESFVKELREIFNSNREIALLISSRHYRIQDRKCTVYDLGSIHVTAGAVIFMAAMVYGDSTTKTKCPYCNTKVPVSAGRNFDTSIDCEQCGQRFSTSLSRPPEPSGAADPATAQTPETGAGAMETMPSPSALFKIVHLLLYPQVRRKPRSQRIVRNPDIDMDRVQAPARHFKFEGAMGGVGGWSPARGGTGGQGQGPRRVTLTSHAGLFRKIYVPRI